MFEEKNCETCMFYNKVDASEFYCKYYDMYLIKDNACSRCKNHKEAKELVFAF